MNGKAISVRFDEDTVTKIDEVAARSGRSRSDLIKDAVDTYLERIVWFEERVRRGIDDVETGRTIPQEKIAVEVRRKARKAGV